MTAAARDRIGLAILAAALYLGALGATDLWAPDEPTSGQVAREMLDTGRWVLPHLNGQYYPDKPPLLFWLIALVSLPAGAVGSVSARLPSAVAGIALVLITYEIGIRTRGRRVALAAALILSTCWMVFDKARSAQTDLLLSACVSAAMLAAVRVRQGGGRAAAAAFALACAAGLLAKGPVGAILPLGAVALWAALERERGFLGRLLDPAALLPALLVVGGWAAVAAVSGRAEGLDLLAAAEQQTVERFLEGRHHLQPAHYYAGALPRGLLPWSLLLPWVLVRAVGGSRRSRAGPAAAWLVFVLVFFTCSAEKRDLYLLPMYPAFALLAAECALAGERGDAGAAPAAGRRALMPLALTCGVLILVGTAGLFVPTAVVSAALPDTGDAGGELLGAGAVPAARFAAALCLPGALLACAALRRGRGLPATGALAAGTAGTLLGVAFLVNPALNPEKSARPLVEWIEREAAASEKEAVAYRLYRAAFSFYGTVRWIPAESPAEVLEAAREHPGILVLTQATDLPALLHDRRLAVSSLGPGRVGHRNYILAAVRPVPEEARRVELVRSLLPVRPEGVHNEKNTHLATGPRSGSGNGDPVDRVRR